MNLSISSSRFSHCMFPRRSLPLGQGSEEPHRAFFLFLCLGRGLGPGTIEAFDKAMTICSTMANAWLRCALPPCPVTRSRAPLWCWTPGQPAHLLITQLQRQNEKSRVYDKRREDGKLSRSLLSSPDCVSSATYL